MCVIWSQFYTLFDAATTIANKTRIRCVGCESALPVATGAVAIALLSTNICVIIYIQFCCILLRLRLFATILAEQIQRCGSWKLGSGADRTIYKNK